MTEQRVTLSANSLIRDNVFSADGENIGNVKEIMLDISSGRIAYIVIECTGWVGLGGELFAVPYHKLSIDQDKKCLVCTMEKEVFEQAPGFNKDDWPDFDHTAYFPKR